jgi:DNA-binding NtrC family response regulator
LNRSERPVSIREDALSVLLRHTWPGNVRELENVITRAIVLAPGGVITPDSIQFAERTHKAVAALELPFSHRDGYWTVIRRVESQLIRTALEDARGNKAEAARVLGIQRRLLYEKMSEFGIAE